MKDEISFVDTNILIYSMDIDAGVKREKAVALLDELWGKETGRISIQVLQEFYVNVCKKLKNKLSPKIASQIINDYLVWQPYSIIGPDIIRAIELEQSFKVSFWDSLIVVAAQQLRATILWTEDLQNGFTFDNVTVKNPFT
jgi:predicted nucleic acid-binding protein